MLIHKAIIPANANIRYLQPTFFYCTAIDSCLKNGMVGVINPVRRPIISPTARDMLTPSAERDPNMGDTVQKSPRLSLHVSPGPVNARRRRRRQLELRFKQ